MPEIDTDKAQICTLEGTGWTPAPSLHPPLHDLWGSALPSKDHSLIRTDFSFGTEYTINRSQIAITSQPSFQSPKPSMGHPTQEFPRSLPALALITGRPGISMVPVFASGQRSRNSVTFFQEGQTKNSSLGQRVPSPTRISPAFPTQGGTPQPFSTHSARQSPPHISFEEQRCCFDDPLQ